MRSEEGLLWSKIDALPCASEISTRAFVVLMSGPDDHVSPENGRELCQTAGEPKEPRSGPGCGHDS